MNDHEAIKLVQKQCKKAHEEHLAADVEERSRYKAIGDARLDDPRCEEVRMWRHGLYKKAKDDMRSALESAGFRRQPEGRMFVLIGERIVSMLVGYESREPQVTRLDGSKSSVPLWSASWSGHGDLHMYGDCTIDVPHGADFWVRFIHV